MGASVARGPWGGGFRSPRPRLPRLARLSLTHGLTAPPCSSGDPGGHMGRGERVRAERGEFAAASPSPHPQAHPPDGHCLRSSAPLAHHHRSRRMCVLAPMLRFLHPDTGVSRKFATGIEQRALIGPVALVRARLPFTGSVSGPARHAASWQGQAARDRGGPKPHGHVARDAIQDARPRGAVQWAPAPRLVALICRGSNRLFFASKNLLHIPRARLFELSALRRTPSTPQTLVWVHALWPCRLSC